MAIGTPSLVLQCHQYQNLRAAIDKDIEKMITLIFHLQEPLISLPEVVLQNARGLGLLFLHQGGLCAALNEDCCFYIDHSGVVKDSMREGLGKLKREREQTQGWFESWFSSSPLLTTLIYILLGPLIVFLLVLTLDPAY